MAPKPIQEVTVDVQETPSAIAHVTLLVTHAMAGTRVSVLKEKPAIRIVSTDCFTKKLVTLKFAW